MMMRSRKEGNSSAGSDTSADDEAMDFYEKMYKYYDIWYEDNVDDVRFYQQMAERHGGPILECMCGTGRILIPLALLGYEISGFDRSYAMLDQLTSKLDNLDEALQENIRVGHGDVRNFQCGRKYKLVIIPFNSFQHLLETEEQEAALRSVADHLQADGQLVLSLFNPRLDRAEGLLRHVGTKTMRNGEVISRFESQTFDHAKQRTNVHYFLDISRQDRELRRVTASFTLRYMFEREVHELMSRCGLEVVETYGDYHFGPLRRNSDLMIFVARKAR
jgi:SAM-dependent methyltransferase